MIDVSPQVGPQADATRATFCPELFFGGARGGGKTFYLLLDFLQDVPTYGANWQGLFIRRTYPELADVIRQAHALYPQTGGVWYAADKEYRWANGAILRFRYLESIADASRYQGHSYTWIAWDELTQWATDEAYLMLFGCLRWSDAPVPTKRIRATGNPGGPGHKWVSERFVRPNRAGYQLLTDDNGWSRLFVPSRVSDNRKLLEADPGYVQRLRMVGSPELVRMWLEGDFDAIAGAYFKNFGSRHIVAPFTVPKRWPIYFGFDWGYASPFCALWAAISDGKDNDGSESVIPKGSIYVFAELYDKGLSNPEIARAILTRQNAWKIADAVADPSIWIEQGGPSIAEQMSREGLFLRPADNSRVAGWSQVHQRINAEPAALYVSTACENLLSQLQQIQADPKDPEDVDTTQEDHAVDALRYIAMARPFLRTPSIVKPFVARSGRVNLGALMDKHRRERNRVRI